MNVKFEDIAEQINNGIKDFFEKELESKSNEFIADTS
jgi:hypothetical protein